MHYVLHFKILPDKPHKPICTILGNYISVKDARERLQDFAVAHVRDECGKRRSENAFVNDTNIDSLYDGLSLYKVPENDEIEVYEKKTIIEPSMWGLSSYAMTSSALIGYFRLSYYERPQQIKTADESASAISTTSYNKSSKKNNHSAAMIAELQNLLSSGKPILKQRIVIQRFEDRPQTKKTNDEKMYARLRCAATGQSLSQS